MVKRTAKPIMHILNECNHSCPYYMPQNMPIPKSETHELQATTDDEGLCWFFSDTMKEKCKCDSPELGLLYKNFSSIGICKNCGHFIIRNKKWEHYNRPYNCRFPYSSIKCQVPEGYNNDVIKTDPKSKIKDPYDLLLENIA